MGDELKAEFKSQRLDEIDDAVEDLRRWAYDERRGRAAWRSRGEAQRTAEEIARLIEKPWVLEP